MEQIPYPKSPKVNVDEVRAITTLYQAQVIKVLFSILLFILTYLFVLAMAIAIFILSLWAASAILSNLKGLYAFVIIGGIVFSAGMFVFFITKFLFQIKKDIDTSRIELKEEEHPLLFEFVKRVCEETEAPFPHKIVVSTAVNASVYYNSSFLGMFLPVRKNLEIGAGLLNCINITEFKAILAHEFGHFSQSSTRLGSYTYRFNKVVHNLLYENEGWLAALNALASAHAILAIFGQLTLWLVRGVMYLFIAVYKLINLSYLALSREMEFHADSVAVSVSGSAPIINALQRLEYGQSIYQYTVQGLLNYPTDKATRAQNFFLLHQENLLHVAKLNNMELEHGLPVITDKFLKDKSVEPRLRYKNIWASHPDTEERRANAFKTEVPADMIYESPWILFKNVRELQEDLSTKIHELQHNQEEELVLETNEVSKYLRTEEAKNELSHVYADYYTYATNVFTPVDAFEPNTASDEEKSRLLSLSVSELFNAGIVTQIKRHDSDLADTETMKLISEGHLEVKRFEFDGKPYTRYYSGDIYKCLKSETGKQKAELELYDKKISNWFYLKAAQKDSDAAQNYKKLLDLNHQFYAHAQAIQDLYQELIRFYHEHILRYGGADDIPYQAKKIREISWEVIRKRDALKQIHLPENSIEMQECATQLNHICEQEIHDLGLVNNLTGFNPLLEDLQKMSNKLNKLSVNLGRQTIRQQGLILASL